MGRLLKLKKNTNNEKVNDPSSYLSFANSV